MRKNKRLSILDAIKADKINFARRKNLAFVLQHSTKPATKAEIQYMWTELLVKELHLTDTHPVESVAVSIKKPIKRLLLGKPTGIGILEAYDFKYYTVTIMSSCVYISKSLFKSQVAELAPLLTNDGEFDIDMKYYTFMSKKDAHHSKQIKDATLYVNWTNVKAPIDAYGDLQLYNAGLYSYEDLLLKYAKGVDINYVSNPYDMNKQIKSIISVAKVLSDSYVNYNTVVWEDPKTYYDAFTVDVRINKYQFTMINNSLRNSKFINYRLIDELPVITKVTSVLKAGNNYVNDTDVSGIITKRIDNKFKFYINNILFSAYNKNQTIECNKVGNIIPLPKPKPDAGYALLKRYYISDSGNYTSDEEKQIFKYMAEEYDHPELSLRGSTYKLLEQLQNIYYYASKETDIDCIYLYLHQEATYDNDAMNVLWHELYLRDIGDADNNIEEHVENMFADLGYIINTLELEENIHLVEIDEDKGFYKLQIK